MSPGQFLVNTKIIPVVLVIVAGLGYYFGLPNEYSFAVLGAGLVAFRSGPQQQ